MNIIKEEKWIFPPRVRKDGTPIERHDTKELIIIQSDHFPLPVIAMSDIHAQTQLVIDKLDEKFYLEQFLVLTCGDMAGSLTMATDGDPTDFYWQFLQKSLGFYFVQGNHDTPSKENIKILHESDNMVKNGSSVNTPIGKISGVNGIISDKSHPYKMSQDEYLKHLNKALSSKPYILMTHDTPALPKLKGNEEIYKMASKYKPKIYFYGHCHHKEFHHHINGTNYFNLDGRILVFVPTGTNPVTLERSPSSDL